jgi:DNA replication regulator DPB11
MGAVHKLDLTSDVTHLIVGDPTTPKYKYVARERPDIVVVTREWVEAVRALWMQGEDIDLLALEDQHRRPAFTDLSICLTGFDDREPLSPPTWPRATFHCGRYRAKHFGIG